LNFICSLQLSEDISTKTAYNLFKENLARAEMLVLVHAFALSNWEKELDFVLGQKDKEQWKVSRGRKLCFLEGYSFLLNFIRREKD
jgi:hypothetical protein